LKEENASRFTKTTRRWNSTCTLQFTKQLTLKVLTSSEEC
jgi:hypothetical protein